MENEEYLQVQTKIMKFADAQDFEFSEKMYSKQKMYNKQK